MQKRKIYDKIEENAWRNKMAVFIETKHTLSRIDKIGKDLVKVKNVVNLLSMIAFALYYAYLIFANIHNIVYVILYSGLFLAILFFYIVDTAIKEKKVLDKENRIIQEKKQKYKTIIKVCKYVLKAVLVGIAIYETVTHFDLGISNIVNIALAIILVVQILIEWVIHYILKEANYIRISMELDRDESKILDFILDHVFKITHLEETLLSLKNESKYTPKEEAMIQEIRIMAEEYKAEQKKKEGVLQQQVSQLKESKVKVFFAKIFKKKMQ